MCSDPHERRLRQSWYERRGKRLLDIGVALPALVLFSPLIALAAALSRISTGNQGIFRQERPGIGARPFTLYKIRTMTDRVDSAGQLLPDGIRLSAAGRLLRRASIDELPSLVNVVKGDMSLVGPRPLLMRYLPFFSESEAARFSVRPGLTGLAQVQGRNLVSWSERLAKDVEYVENVGLCSDLKIILKTVGMLMTARGVVADPSSLLQDLDVERTRNGGV